MALPLGSRTSGVDGSSEGGRVNTVLLPNVLVLYGVSLIQHLRSQGLKGKVGATPVQEDGVWCLKLVFDGDPPEGVPSRWHGHHVIVEKAASA